MSYLYMDLITGICNGSWFGKENKTLSCTLNYCKPTYARLRHNGAKKLMKSQRIFPQLLEPALIISWCLRRIIALGIAIGLLNKSEITDENTYLFGLQMKYNLAMGAGNVYLNYNYNLPSKDFQTFLRPSNLPKVTFTQFQTTSFHRLSLASRRLIASKFWCDFRKYFTPFCYRLAARRSR